MKKLITILLLALTTTACTITVTPTTPPTEPHYTYGEWYGNVYQGQFYTGRIFVNYNNQTWRYCNTQQLYCEDGTTQGWNLMQNGRIEFYADYNQTEITLIKRLNNSVRATLTR